MSSLFAGRNGAKSHGAAGKSTREAAAESLGHPRTRLRTSTVATAAALGGLFGLAVTVAILWLFFRGSTPPLTAEMLATAQNRWESAGISSYNLELELVGSQAGKIQVEVRDGEVTRMIRNGYQPSQTRTWYYWSVPGQFETIAIDLEAAQHPEQGFGVAPGTRAVLRADFDNRFGYPKFYQRILLGTGIHVEWRTTRFEVVR